MERVATWSAEPILKSSLYRTAPVDCPPGSAAFVNAVVGLLPRPGETPESLLLKMQAVEREFGRPPRRIVNEPRPLDLDLIVFARETRADPQLTLPHPRATRRRFVLKPLAEIAPRLVLPGHTRAVQELLAQLRGDEIEIIR